MELVWVRWFEQDLGYMSGRKAKRLHRLNFLSSSDPSAFGFIDPKNIVRGVHLIPGFAHGKTQDLLPRSVGRPCFEQDGTEGQENDTTDDDWCCYYVNM